ncbi:MAG: hypothetical protein CM15mP45_15920 [Deltaproteobacteria bacterium]|nr:MAG: hypothetical protein CM15mP45_15920 [Deltaproteobacteria bacterium]
MTFVSKIDHSVQYYSIRYPKNYDPQKSYAAIFSLHGAGVEASLLASQYSSKDWAFVITPTNRRPYGFDWQDWGRLDFLEVYDLAVKALPIDQERVYLSGGSMGGQGTWHIGLHHPSLFALWHPRRMVDVACLPAFCDATEPDVCLSGNSFVKGTGKA